MDSDLLDLPLGVKIHVKPGSKPLFCRGKLGEEFRVPCLYFTLDDPYNHHLSTAYNCLHDPHLLDYHIRKDVLKLLKRQGFVTSDNKVLCTLKEFNEYRRYLTRQKLRAEYMSRHPEEWVHPPPLKSKRGLRLPGAFNTEQWLKVRKCSSPRPHKRRETTVTLGQEDASLPGRVSTDAGSQRKADVAADRWVRALLEQLSPAEAQKLQDLALAVVLRVFGSLKVPRDQRVSFLRRAAEGIRRRSSGSCLRSEPSGTSRDDHQNLEALAQELVATVLDMLGNHLESRIPEAGSAARQEELPADGGVTQAERSKEAETATFHRARLEACLDKLTGLVIRNVQKLLKSMVASQFEGDSSSEYTETLELHSGRLSRGQPQPRRTRFSKQGREARRAFSRPSEVSTGVKLPLLQQKCPAGRTSYAPTLESEVLETVEETMEEEKSVTTSGCPSDLRSMAKQISRSTIQRIFQCGPAPTPDEDFSAPTDKATSRGGRQSCATEDTFSSVGRWCSCQPVPPGRPKPPAQTRAQHRAVHPKPL